MHPDFGQLVDYFRGELDAAQAQQLRERLEADAGLFAQWETLKRTYAVIRSLPAPAPRVAIAEPSPAAELPLTNPRPAYVADLRREFETRGWHNLLPWLTPAAPWVNALRADFAVRAIVARLPLLRPGVSFIKSLRVEFGVRAAASRLPAMNARPDYVRALRLEFGLRSIVASLPLLTPSERFKRRLKVAIYEASQRGSSRATPVAAPAPVPQLAPSDPFRRRLFAALATARRVVLRPARIGGWQPRGRELVARVKRSKSLAVTAGVHLLAVLIAFFVTPALVTSQTPHVAQVNGQYAIYPAIGAPQPVGEVIDHGIALGPHEAPRAIDPPAVDPELIGMDLPPQPLAPHAPESPDVLPLERITPPAGAPAVDAQAWFRLRNQPRERKMEYLGSAELYEALDRALAYLQRTQEQDGGWGFKDVNPVLVPADINLREIRRVELTAAALLAYLGDGHSGKSSALGYDYNVSRGIKFLVSRQHADGQIGPDGNDVVFCHAMATLALVENFALTGDAALRAPMRKACRWLADSFAVDGAGKNVGAFPYRRGQGPSLMTSVWAHMALATARNVMVPQVDAPASRMESLMAWFAEESRGRQVLDYQQDALNGDLVPTAAAAALTAFAGDEGFALRRESYLDRVLREPVDLVSKPDRMKPQSDMRFAFFGSLAQTLNAARGGGWSDSLAKGILKQQARDGFNEGSFENAGYYADLYGRVFSTAFAALSIENAYRVASLRGK